MYPTCILPRQKTATPPEINSCSLRINPEKEKENHLDQTFNFGFKITPPEKSTWNRKKLVVWVDVLSFSKKCIFFQVPAVSFWGAVYKFSVLRVLHTFYASHPLPFLSLNCSFLRCFFRRQVARTHLLGIRFTSGDQPGWLRLEGISDQLGFIYPLRLAVFLGWGWVSTLRFPENHRNHRQQQK